MKYVMLMIDFVWMSSLLAMEPDRPKAILDKRDQVRNQLIVKQLKKINFSSFDNILVLSAGFFLLTDSLNDPSCRQTITHVAIANELKKDKKFSVGSSLDTVVKKDSVDLIVCADWFHWLEEFEQEEVLVNLSGYLAQEGKIHLIVPTQRGTALFYEQHKSMEKKAYSDNIGKYSSSIPHFAKPTEICRLLSKVKLNLKEMREYEFRCDFEEQEMDEAIKCCAALKYNQQDENAKKNEEEKKIREKYLQNGAIGVRFSMLHVQGEIEQKINPDDYLEAGEEDKEVESEESDEEDSLLHTVVKAAGECFG